MGADLSIGNDALSKYQNANPVVPNKITGSGIVSSAASAPASGGPDLSIGNTALKSYQDANPVLPNASPPPVASQADVMGGNLSLPSFGGGGSVFALGGATDALGNSMKVSANPEGRKQTSVTPGAGAGAPQDAAGPINGRPQDTDGDASSGVRAPGWTPPPGPVTNAVAAAQPAGMTTEQANQVYGAQNAVQRARDAQQMRDSTQASVASGQAAQTRYDADIATRNAQGGAGMNPREKREALVAAAALKASGVAQTNAAAAVGSNRNLVQDAIAQTEQGQKAQTHLVQQAAGQQGLQEGAQKIESTSYDIKHKAALQDTIDAMHNAKSPEESESAMQRLRVLMGHGPQMKYINGGATRIGTDANGQPIMGGGYTVGYDESNPGFKPIIIDPNAGSRGPQEGAAPADWMARAKAANPGMTDAQIQAEYAKKAKQ